MPEEHRNAAERRSLIEEGAPKLWTMINEVSLGDIWERPGLSKRDRSLATVAALVALGAHEQLDGHVERALANGFSREELGELFAHLACMPGFRRRRALRTWRDRRTRV